MIMRWISLRNSSDFVERVENSRNGIFAIIFCFRRVKFGSESSCSSFPGIGRFRWYKLLASSVFLEPVLEIPGTILRNEHNREQEPFWFQIGTEILISHPWIFNFRLLTMGSGTCVNFYISVVQEEYAFALEMLGVHEEALIQYDELEALFSQFIKNSSLTGKLCIVTGIWVLDSDNFVLELVKNLLTCRIFS